MKYYSSFFLCVFILGISITIVIAQENEFVLEDLKAPSMPAATIIGTQVNEVNQPKSLKALETAILSNYLDENKNITIPNNYALEINPFMLSGRKNFSYTEYVKEELWQTPIRNFSASIASTTDFILSDSISSNAMGFGFRTILYNGKVNEELKNAYGWAIEKNQKVLDIKTKIRTYIDDYVEDICENDTTCNLVNLTNYVKTRYEKDYIESIGKPDTLTKSEQKYLDLLQSIKDDLIDFFGSLPVNTELTEVNNYFEAFYDTNWSQGTLEALKELLEEVKYQRDGLRIELNYANALNFPTNNFDDYTSSRWGLWMNVSYKFSKIKHVKEGEDISPVSLGREILGNFEFLTLGRIIKNNEDFINKYSPADTSYSTGNIYDAGIRVMYDFNKLSIGFEYIYRVNRNKIYREIDGAMYSRTINNDTKKYMLNINYSLKDNVVISYNIGKNFDTPFNNSGNLISGLTFNFGFGDIRADELIK